MLQICLIYTKNTTINMVSFFVQLGLKNVRCGFLGLLHLDVFRQRLTSEYGATDPLSGRFLVPENTKSDPEIRNKDNLVGGFQPF